MRDDLTHLAQLVVQHGHALLGVDHFWSGLNCLLNILVARSVNVGFGLGF
ncbi:MAG: hypothetical protein R3C56_08210 [Pirellulaceae bacterium]